MLAAQHSGTRAARRTRLQVQQLSPEKASHARAVAEQAVAHVHNLLANRHAGHGRGGSTQVTPPLLSSAELRGCGLGPEDPLRGRRSIPRSPGAANEVGMVADIASPRRAYGESGHHVLDGASKRAGTVRCKAVVCEGAAGSGEQRPEGAVGMRSAQSAHGPYGACLNVPSADGSAVELSARPEQGDIGGASCGSRGGVLVRAMESPGVSERGGDEVSPVKRNIRVPGMCSGIAHYISVYVLCGVSILTIST